jgi:hypothetical protein
VTKITGDNESSGSLHLKIDDFPTFGGDSHQRRPTADSAILDHLGLFPKGGFDLDGKIFTALGTPDQNLFEPVHDGS